MPLNLPLMRGGGLHFLCDAMLAGTSHYPYTSSSHDLLSGCKDRCFFCNLQTFPPFSDFRIVKSVKSLSLFEDFWTITPAMHRSINKARREFANGETIKCGTPEEMQRYFDSL